MSSGAMLSVARNAACQHARRLSTSAAAACADSNLHLNTPLLFSGPLSERLEADVYIKMDCMQPPGSFKIRGIGKTSQTAAARGVTHLVSSSGGNAGLATAFAGKQLGLPVTVVLPESTPSHVADKLKLYGATSIFHGAHWAEANDKAMELAEELNGELIHPFENEITWKGHSTVVHEIAEVMDAPPDCFVTVCGGGGLLMGILIGLKDVGWDDVPVVVAETVGADSLAQSLEAGELVTLPGITSIAKSLGATRVSEDVFHACQTLGPGLVKPWVTDDAAATRACVQFLEDHRVLVEPACGAGLAAVYEKAPALAGCNTVVVEVCGGALVDKQNLQEWLAL